MKESEFQKRISEIRERDGCSAVQAMRKAREEHPQAFEAYQKKSDQPVKPWKVRWASACESRKKWEALVEQVGQEVRRHRPNAPHLAIMQEARRRHPEAFAAFRSI